MVLTKGKICPYQSLLNLIGTYGTLLMYIENLLFDTNKIMNNTWLFNCTYVHTYIYLRNKILTANSEVSRALSYDRCLIIYRLVSLRQMDAYRMCTFFA